MHKEFVKPQMVTANQLGDMLGVSQRHIWRMKALGKLPMAVQIGRCVRWYLKDIERWLELSCPDMLSFASKKLQS